MKSPFTSPRVLAAAGLLVAVIIIAVGVLHLPLSWLASAIAFGTVGFSQIPSNLRVPFTTIEFNTSKAQQGPALLSYRVLIVGQKLAGGAWAANSINLATTVEQVIAGAGRGSMLHRMALQYFANNRFTQTYFGVLADDAGGTAATGTLTVTGPATAAGTLSLYLGGTLVSVAVASGDSANSIATNINAAINAAADLPVTSTVLNAVVTVTFRHKGTVGNSFDMRLNYQDGEATPAGVAVAIVALATGATNPATATLIANMGDVWYHVIGLAYGADATIMSAFEAELLRRDGPLVMADGLVVASASGTQSALTTLGSARNSGYSVIVAQAGKNPLTPPMEFAAAATAVIAYNGNIDPARPFQTLQLVGAPASPLRAPAMVDQFTFTERNLLLFSGIATTKVDASGAPSLERMVTTYETAASGASDTSYLDANTRLTLQYLRYSFRTAIGTQFARSKLANDGTRVGQGQDVVTPSKAAAAALAWFRDMELKGLVENYDQFKRDLVVERDVNDPNRLNFLLPPDLMNQLVVTAVRVDFRV